MFFPIPSPNFDGNYGFSYGFGKDYKIPQNQETGEQYEILLHQWNLTLVEQYTNIKVAVRWQMFVTTKTTEQKKRKQIFILIPWTAEITFKNKTPYSVYRYNLQIQTLQLSQTTIYFSPLTLLLRTRPSVWGLLSIGNLMTLRSKPGASTMHFKPITSKQIYKTQWSLALIKSKWRISFSSIGTNVRIMRTTLILYWLR